ncbi:coiled-coil domain-containing protein [Flavobacterium tibetense]|uniref:Uncharacterized protein n=1 Tax=Flavobacterium tibetense TaxID=2233533 RepID=A0A365NZ28_9FLAO|nr:hypothetical protein [Flavobacterium tibetense]RBA27452.1 hypothetical protein DPN68_12065 [Flavobacterium tibetense]
MNNNYLEQDNDWANNIEGKPIHITQAESGAKGYYCMGCDKDMQAVKRKKKEYKSYFRHHVKDVDNSKKECVHASREYREKLAFFYFMRTKQITVPAVYKYPPKGVEGFPNLLKEKETIFAHKVDKEVTFFEDEDGKIHWEKDVKVDERYLWVRPDAVFFDKDGKPILFIEFVVTHKPDIDKLNKLQRLGINTVQIVIPKLPEAELEKEISKVSKVKWTYNEIESNTEYVPISEGNTEGVPSIDDDQRKLFDESYKCRAAQVGNLIRSITRCLESQSYKRTERLFEQEIQRIEKATREHQSRFDEQEAKLESEISSELRERREKLDLAKEQHAKEQTGWEQEYSGLERRYFKRRREIREEQENTNREIELRFRIGKTEDDIRREFEYEERFIESEQETIDEQQGKILRDIESESRFKDNFESRRESLKREFDELEGKEYQNFISAKSDLESKISRFREFKAEIDSGIRSEFERQYNEIAERVDKRDLQSGDELSERIKSILELRGFFGSYSDGQATIEKYRKGIQLIKNGTWKEWD